MDDVGHPRRRRSRGAGTTTVLLAVGAPLAVVIALATTPFAPQSHAWVTTIAMTAVLLGGGAGLIVAVRTLVLVPGPDPHQQASALDHGDTTGQSLLMTFFATVVIAAPTAVLLAVGAATHTTITVWSAIAVGSRRARRRCGSAAVSPPATSSGAAPNCSNE